MSPEEKKGNLYVRTTGVEQAKIRFAFPACNVFPIYSCWSLDRTNEHKGSYQKLI